MLVYRYNHPDCNASAATSTVPLRGSTTPQAPVLGPFGPLLGGMRGPRNAGRAVPYADRSCTSSSTAARSLSPRPPRPNRVYNTLSQPLPDASPPWSESHPTKHPPLKVSTIAAKGVVQRSILGLGDVSGVLPVQAQILEQLESGAHAPHLITPKPCFQPISSFQVNESSLSVVPQPCSATLILVVTLTDRQPSVMSTDSSEPSGHQYHHPSCRVEQRDALHDQKCELRRTTPVERNSVPTSFN